jgi:alpha-glucosidase
VTWWESGVIYEIYPRSFQDSDGDGVGDLRGIAQRLPYVRDLGVDAIWMTPIYPSPQRDFGYDITDHAGIDPQYGTLDDFHDLVARAHSLGLKVIMDYVPNHTSDLHPWFQDPSKRDWYLWHDGPPPNNWISVFGGSAWEPVGDHSYYHAYLKEQPDLNWRSPAVRDAMLDVIRVWIERGVDGFRVDAMRQVLKDPELRDNPADPSYRPGMPEYDSLLPLHTADRDEVQEIVALIREAIGDRLMIAEVYAPIERLVRYYGGGAHLPSNMHLISTAWDAEAIADLIERYEAALPEGGWPNWVLGNHDRRAVAAVRRPGGQRGGRTGDAHAAQGAAGAAARVRDRALSDAPRLGRGAGLRARRPPRDRAQPHERAAAAAGRGRGRAQHAPGRRRHGAAGQRGRRS